MIHKVEICGVDTASLEVISAARMKELMPRIKAGDDAARDECIRGNLKLVLSVIRRFASRRENRDDLFQVGCIGLIKSIDRFDPTLDVCFSTYAVPMIIGEIRRYLRDNTALRVSRSLRDTAYKVLTAREALTAQNNAEPSVEEIALTIGIPRSEIVMALEAVAEPVSLSSPLYGDEDDPLSVLDRLGTGGESDDDWVDEITLREAIGSLSDREKRILALRYFDGRTQTEVSAEIGLSQAQVSRLEKAALTRIKDSI